MMDDIQVMTRSEVALYNNLIRQAHQTSVEKGWWINGVHYLRAVNLILSEVGEFYDAHRKGGLSEKIPSFSHACEELADIVIRVMDWFGHMNLTFNHEDVQPDDDIGFDQLVYNIYEDMMQFTPEHYRMPGTWVLCSCVQLAEFIEEDLYKAVLAKMEYNKTRPYRHGGLEF